jgi:hypothetical protein
VLESPASRRDRQREPPGRWRRYRARLRAGRMVPDDLPDIGVDELEFLIRTQCLAESEAADRRAVGCAIARAVTQN